MVNVKIKRVFIILVAIVFFAFSLTVVRAQELTPTPTPTPGSTSQKQSDLQNQIKELEAKLVETQGQKKTLSSQIATMDNQIKLTELRIDGTKQEIEELNKDIEIAGKKIVKLEGSLEDQTKVLINRIVATYQVGTLPPFTILLSSNDVSSFFTRLNYLKIVQAHDKKLVYDTEQAKVDYENQKAIFEEKKQKVEALKKQLEGYTQQLEVDKKVKQEFLQVTQNDEKKYQQLLAQARAEYEAIVGIIAGKGTETEIGKVNQGERIASMISGASCNSSGTHLHFTVSRNGAAQNPFSFLKSVSYVNQSNGDPFNPSGSWEWPIDPPIEFNQGFGSDTWYVRTYHFYPNHNGIDISGSSLTVKAVKSGTLFRGSYAGYKGCTLPYVRVNHSDDGLDTFYLHVIH